MPVRWMGGAVALCILSFAQGLAAEERRIVLAASAGLSESGFLDYLLPRFSLKTGIRVTPVVLEDGIQVDVKLGPADVVKDGRAALRGGKTVYAVRVAEGGAGKPGHARRFVDWLLSKVGQRTVESFRANGRQVYLAAAAAKAKKARPMPTGDLARGEKLSFLHCGRGARRVPRRADGPELQASRHGKRGPVVSPHDLSQPRRRARAGDRMGGGGRPDRAQGRGARQRFQPGCSSPMARTFRRQRADRLRPTRHFDRAKRVEKSFSLDAAILCVTDISALPRSARLRSI